MVRDTLSSFLLQAVGVCEANCDGARRRPVTVVERHAGAKPPVWWCEDAWWLGSYLQFRHTTRRTTTIDGDEAQDEPKAAVVRIVRRSPGNCTYFVMFNMLGLMDLGILILGFIDLGISI